MLQMLELPCKKFKNDYDKYVQDLIEKRNYMCEDIRNYSRETENI